MIKIISLHLSYYGSASYAPQNSHLLIDEDDKVFINYLYGLQEVYNTNEDIMEYIEKIQKHRDIIFTKLNNFKDNKKLYSKYEWVAQYHNYYCEEYFKSNEIQQFNLKVSGLQSRDFSRIAK